MPPPLDPAKRSAILADIRSRKKARNQIARDHEVSVSTVTRIAQHEGLTDAFDRSETKRATAAKVADQRLQRATTSQRFLDECNGFLDELHEPHMVFNIGGRDNVYTEHLMDEPPTTDKRNLMVSAGVAFDKHLAADRHDSDGEVEGVVSLLGGLFGQLKAKYTDAPAE